MQDPVESRTAAEHLDDALARMSWSVEHGEFALVGFVEPPCAADLALLAHPPCQIVREPDETTMLVPASELSHVLAAHPTARIERDLVWIRFDTPMGWNVVGFLAQVTSALARAGVPLGVVCGFSRDHVFVHRRYLESTRAVLSTHFPERPFARA